MINANTANTKVCLIMTYPTAAMPGIQACVARHHTSRAGLAAISFGANKWYLLSKVDLPLAAPSIRAGINQTIMLSLAMVVVASLIGAKGLGEDVLEALQYANVGQGILAGFAILFCAMILDRIVQGARK